MLLGFESGVHKLGANVLVPFPSFLRYPVVALRNNILVEHSQELLGTHLSHGLFRMESQEDIDHLAERLKHAVEPVMPL